MPAQLQYYSLAVIDRERAVQMNRAATVRMDRTGYFAFNTL